MYGLNQLIDYPTRITCNTSTLIDHILKNTQENISQSDVIYTVISDHSLIYCTIKIPKVKCNKLKEITFRSLKNYSADLYEGTLERFSFPNNENFDNPDIAYGGFITRLDFVINAVAPFKTLSFKKNARERFNGEIAGKIHTRGKLHTKIAC